MSKSCTRPAIKNWGIFVWQIKRSVVISSHKIHINCSINAYRIQPEEGTLRWGREYWPDDTAAVLKKNEPIWWIEVRRSEKCVGLSDFWSWHNKGLSMETAQFHFKRLAYEGGLKSKWTSWRQVFRMHMVVVRSYLMDTYEASQKLFLCISTTGRDYYD